LPACPSKSFGTILDTLDVCNDSAELFDFLKNTLLRQFGKSKWQSYFELLHLPMEMQGLKAQCSHGKAQTTSPLQEYRPDNDLFLSFFWFVVFSCRIISSRFVWRGLSSDVTAWARGCLACQRGKIHHHIRLVPQPIPIPQRRFSHLHVDLVGPLQYSNNFDYILLFLIICPNG
jgi:hypothetical protein